MGDYFRSTGGDRTRSEYDRIEWNGTQARAFKGEALKLYDFDENGNEQASSEFKKHFTITIGAQRASRINMPRNGNII